MVGDKMAAGCLHQTWVLEAEAWVDGCNGSAYSLGPLEGITREASLLACHMLYLLLNMSSKSSVCISISHSHGLLHTPSQLKAGWMGMGGLGSQKGVQGRKSRPHEASNQEPCN